METNSDRFEVEHSGDAKSWKLIGTVKSGGESTSLKSYVIRTKYPKTGTTATCFG